MKEIKDEGIFVVPWYYCKQLPRTIHCKVCRETFKLKNRQIHYHCGTMVAVLVHNGLVVQ